MSLARSPPEDAHHLTRHQRLFFFSKGKSHLRFLLLLFVFNEVNTVNSNRGLTLPTCNYIQFPHNLYVTYINIYIFTPYACELKSAILS